MAFVKVVKNKAYFKRFQVKYRRRREGKTDYHARRRLVLQDKNKYGSPKYRFVPRFSNKKITCQVIYSTLLGDKVVVSATSDELKNYGVKVGLTNYAAAYCTGLLAARRLLKNLKLDETFKGLENATGEEFHIEETAEDRRPFKCLLDVGIVKTTKGNRVFGAMKGACDGGLHIPHSTKRFPGFTQEGDDGKYNAEEHRDRIFGKHVANYMKEMQEENPDKYDAHFSEYAKNGIKADDIENMYKNAHKKIRANPVLEKKKRTNEPVRIRQGDVIKTSKGSYKRMRKLTCDQRKERVQKKLQLVAEMACAE